MTIIARHITVLLEAAARRTGAVWRFVLPVAAAGAIACQLPSEEATDRGHASLRAAPVLNVDLSQTSASGLSSGAFMAVQFHVAFSSIMKGVAVFAGGPFACAKGSVATAVTTCMSSSSRLDASPFVAVTKAYAADGAIDSVDNLHRQRVFLFGGADDTTVNPAVMDGLFDYYAAFVAPSSLSFERRREATGHTMPTKSYGVDCATTSSPYLGRCGYDGAGEALSRIYGPLAPRASEASRPLIAIPQGDFIASPSAHGLGETAWVYVPAACADGERCRIHVAFHGCKQSVTSVGDAFDRHAGYNEWAETNHLIVLYPQAGAVQGTNPNGCWDWFGYDGPDYAKKNAPQMAMVRAIIDRLAGQARTSESVADE